MSWLLITAALAQDVTVGGDAPTLNAQVFTPSIDSTRFVRLTDSDLGGEGLSTRATVGYHRAPLHYIGTDRRTSLLLYDLVAADLGAAWTFEHARIGIGLPVMMHSTDGSTVDESGVGDLALDAKWRWLDGEDGLGSALSARVLAPTSTMQLGLANTGWGFDAELAVDRDVGPVKWLGTAAWAWRPEHAMENVTWGPQVRLGLGASTTVNDRTSLSAELAAGQVLNDLSNRAGRPLELVVGGHRQVGDRTLVRPAVALGLNGSVGTPQYRAVISFARIRPVDLDSDGDGLVDADDACPDQAEDFDRYQDEDGCPEDTLVRISLIDTDGEEPTDHWMTGGQEGRSGDEAELPAGEHEFTVGDDAVVAEVPSGPPVEMELEVPAPRGTLAVRAVDPEGQPVPDARWSGRGDGQVPTTAVGEPVEVRPGEWWVRVAAPGHAPGMGETSVVEDEPAEVVVVLIPTPADSDGDGLVDREDACPDEAEDFDGWKDADGCPEDTVVTVQVVDTDGEPADRPWKTGPVSGQPGDSVELPAGERTFEAPEPLVATVPEGPPTELELVVAAPRGTLTVAVVDSAGAPVEGAEWEARGDTRIDDVPAGEAARVRPGEYTVRAYAPGYRRGEASVRVVEDATATLTLELLPSQAQLVADRIEIRDSVYFETASDVIEEESHALLDEVAEILLDHPELRSIRIEGHTDSRGTNQYNLDLSQRRAESVERYLVEAGVSAERLEAVGFGEEHPLAKAATPLAWSLNRRVDFFVVERSDEAVASQ